MKKTLVITITIVLLSSVLCSACSQNPTNPKLEDLDEIRNASVLITMQLPKLSQSLEKSILLGYGIGSLVEYQGEILLVTHNHWRKVLEDTSLVKFYDSENRLIKTIIGKEWRDLIIHADAGTLVLRPPQELIDQLVPVSLQAVPQLEKGEIVEIVCRESPARETAAIQQAVVEETLIYNDQPVYKLRTLNGEPIQPGDSGGGVWHEGALIGNNWTVTGKSNVPLEAPEEAEDENVILTDLSYAAALPENIP